MRKFNGKEVNREFGLEWSDFGARFYDGQVARWVQVDPLAEKFYQWSPLNSMSANPIFWVDPDGRAPKGGEGEGEKRKKLVVGQVREVRSNIISIVPTDDGGYRIEEIASYVQVHGHANFWSGGSGSTRKSVQLQARADFKAYHTVSNVSKTGEISIESSEEIASEVADRGAVVVFDAGKLAETSIKVGDGEVNLETASFVFFPASTMDPKENKGTALTKLIGASIAINPQGFPLLSLADKFNEGEGAIGKFEDPGSDFNTLGTVIKQNFVTKDVSKYPNGVLGKGDFFQIGDLSEYQRLQSNTALKPYNK